MNARAPLDIDLEDQLLYGLTPMRLAYAVLAGLGALATWSSHAGLPVLRGLVALVLLLVGAALAWGRWRGRPADRWLADIARFVLTAHRVRWGRE
jgi:hypothetical protein